MAQKDSGVKASSWRRPASISWVSRCGPGWKREWLPREGKGRGGTHEATVMMVPLIRCCLPASCRATAISPPPPTPPRPAVTAASAATIATTTTPRIRLPRPTHPPTHPLQPRGPSPALTPGVRSPT